MMFGAIRGRAASISDSAQPDVTVEDWMEDLATRTLVGPLYLSRFVEPMWFLTQPIGWRPNVGRQIAYAPVQAPRGFVTDLASVPRVFFSVLRPDGEYAYAAILHDYLYWSQAVPREVADQTFKLAMEDLEVSPVVIRVIFEAVARFGQSAWETNAKLRAAGEKRILQQFPTSPTTRWRDWKKVPGVFKD
jgi:hypothetical protein